MGRVAQILFLAQVCLGALAQTDLCVRVPIAAHLDQELEIASLRFEHLVRSFESGDNPLGVTPSQLLQAAKTLFELQGVETAEGNLEGSPALRIEPGNTHSLNRFAYGLDSVLSTGLFYSPGLLEGSSGMHFSSIQANLLPHTAALKPKVESVSLHEAMHALNTELYNQGAVTLYQGTITDLQGRGELSIYEKSMRFDELGSYPLQVAADARALKRTKGTEFLTQLKKLYAGAWHGGHAADHAFTQFDAAMNQLNRAMFSQEVVSVNGVDRQEVVARIPVNGFLIRVVLASGSVSPKARFDPAKLRKALAQRLTKLTNQAETIATYSVQICRELKTQEAAFVRDDHSGLARIIRLADLQRSATLGIVNENLNIPFEELKPWEN